MKRYGIMLIVVVLAVALSETWSFAELSRRGRRGRDDDEKSARRGDRDKTPERSDHRDRDEDKPEAKAPERRGPQRGFQGRGRGEQRGFQGRGPQRGPSQQGPSEEMKRRFAEMHKKGAEASKADPKSREEFFKKMHEAMRARMSQHKGPESQRGFQGRGPQGGFFGRGSQQGSSSRGPGEEMKRRFMDMRKKGAEASESMSRSKGGSRVEFFKKMHEAIRNRMSQNKGSGFSQARSKSSGHSNRSERGSRGDQRGKSRRGRGNHHRGDSRGGQSRGPQASFGRGGSQRGPQASFGRGGRQRGSQAVCPTCGH